MKASMGVAVKQAYSLFDDQGNQGGNDDNL
jgi:hypothetical protein